MSLSTQASCHYTHKHHVNIQTSVTSLSTLVFQTSVVIIQTSITSLSKQATSLSKQASRHYPNKRHVIMQRRVTSLSKQDKRHVIIQTRQASRHYPNKTGVMSLSKQAPKPLYWHILPSWYSRYEHVHPYKLFTECTRVNRCTSVNPCCTTADSFTRLLPTQCWLENGVALPHTLFLLATVKDRNRLAWCDLYFYFTSARPWEKSRLYWWNANNNNIIIVIVIIIIIITTAKQ